MSTICSKQADYLRIFFLVSRPIIHYLTVRVKSRQAKGMECLKVLIEILLYHQSHWLNIELVIINSTENAANLWFGFYLSYKSYPFAELNNSGICVRDHKLLSFSIAEQYNSVGKIISFMIFTKAKLNSFRPGFGISESYWREGVDFLTRWLKRVSARTRIISPVPSFWPIWCTVWKLQYL